MSAAKKPNKSQAPTETQTPGTITALHDVFHYLSPRRRRQLAPVVALMLFGAIAEVVSLGAILPFLAVVSNPKEAVANPGLRSILDIFGIVTPMRLVIATAVLFAVSAVIAAATRMLLVWASQKFVFGVAQELSVLVYSRTLHQPYSYHTEHNSSQTLAAISKAQMLTTGLLVPMIQSLSSAVIAIFILFGLVLIDPLVAVLSATGFGAIYIVVIRITRQRMRANGRIIAKAQKDRMQAANEGLGGIRDVLLDHSQLVFIKRFATVEHGLRKAQATNSLISQSPRFVVEGLGLVLIAFVAVILSQRDGGLASALPVLGALALGAQRLLPLIQQLFTGWSASMTNEQVLRDVLAILELPENKNSEIFSHTPNLAFNEAIRLQNVSFSYPRAGRPALVGINLTIPKGARVGFIGRTGSGKSTLMDLILGLLAPESGRILIDDTELNSQTTKAWQARIAHVPQVIYLSDASLAENIAFGIPKQRIDMTRVEKVAAQADLSDVINKLPDRYETFVGERGVRLSGGQRQRVGIARALYKQADVLIFDEATSALDTETEKTVIDAIEGLDRSLTIIMIAHRLSTVERCDFTVELEPS